MAERMTKQGENRIVKAYTGNPKATMVSVGKEVGFSPTTVRRVLDRRGVQRRPRGGFREITKPRRRMTPADKKIAIRKYVKEQLPIRAIAEFLDRSYGSVHRVLDQAEGVTMRRRGGPRKK